MDTFNTSEFDNALAAEESARLLQGILKDCWPDKEATDSERGLEEYLRLYKTRYEKITLMFGDELNESAEKPGQAMIGKKMKEGVKIC